MAALSAAGMGLPSHDATRQMIAKRIISVATILSLSMLLSPNNSVHAFLSPLNVAPPLASKSSSLMSPSFVPTQLSVLQPSKGGIIVEAKSDYVARDILIDSFMGRDSASSSGENELGWKDPQHNLDVKENYASNESSWLQSPNNRRMGQQVRQQHSQFKSASIPPPPSQPPKPIIMQPQQQFLTQKTLPSSSAGKQSPMNSTSGNTKSKLPDPSLMKLSDIQGELSLRRIAYNDCFDRTSLEAKLREARLAMMTSTTPRASPAEQAIFSSSLAGARAATSATTNSVVPTSSPSSSSGNPFRRQSGVKNNNRGGGQNSSSSFRDNSHGIGFGDANSYYSSFAPRGGGSGNSGGVGVRLGKQRTSYGEFGGSGSGVTSRSGAGGSTSIFNNGSGGIAGDGGGREINSNFGGERISTPPFAVGGMSIKGDSTILSSAGFVGQQGTVINAFSENGGSRRSSTGGSFAGATSRNTAVSARGAVDGSPGWSGAGCGKVFPPVPPLEESRFDLVQNLPEINHDFLGVANYDAGYNDLSAWHDIEFHTSYNLKWMSQQYQEQGLDFLSGGQEGFGAIMGIETSRVGSSNRAPASDTPLPRSSGGPGNTGVTMGGDFASYGIVGEGQRRSSARYSGGGDNGVDGIDED